MLDKEQRLTEAAMRYLAHLEGDQPVHIADFVTTVDADLRDELGPYLELILAVGDVAEPTALSTEEQAMVDAATQRIHIHYFGQAATMPLRTLTEARKAHKLGINALAAHLNLPPDLLARIERGGVQAATIPSTLIRRLAERLRQTEERVHALLAAPVSSSAGVQLSAQDGTTLQPETTMSFAEALRASSATDAQRAEWDRAE
jgi:hypothetical protein